MNREFKIALEKKRIVPFPAGKNAIILAQVSAVPGVAAIR